MCSVLLMILAKGIRGRRNPESASSAGPIFPNAMLTLRWTFLAYRSAVSQPDGSRQGCTEIACTKPSLARGCVPKGKKRRASTVAEVSATYLHIFRRTVQSLNHDWGAARDPCSGIIILPRFQDQYSRGRGNLEEEGLGRREPSLHNMSHGRTATTRCNSTVLAKMRWCCSGHGSSPKKEHAWGGVGTVSVLVSRGAGLLINGGMPPS
ncbi:hypothetical protein FB567DRAFT_287643 [Paraphoma chrysanthemicola]|uniref:Uncharacterized protein n=1 Tax=Paraphoma chrysanthemicola TaxID=798071 RepID=A0A8K0RCC7_9PLEO|nr:hypothetical protein FB567DRAFT_287643 [Paraphoma chrysanthemicola]